MTAKLRMMAWAGAALLVLLVPLIAMQVGDSVRWTPFDFLVAGALLAGVGLAYEAAARLPRDGNYRAAAALALGTAAALIWANLAVGFIGSEDHPANRLYAGVLAIAAAGAAIARLQPAGMVWAMAAAALAQAGVGVFGATVDAGVLAPTAAFVLLWLAAAWFFRRAGAAKT